MKKIYKILIIIFSILSVSTGIGFGIDALETKYLQNEFATFRGDDLLRNYPIDAKLGHHNGGIAIFYDTTYYPATHKYCIGEYYFYFECYTDIWYYKAHKFYLLREAYNLGLIDIKDVGRIHKRYVKYIETRYNIEYISY